jgi:N-acetyl-anhydromuramyl-L-alanine amidase AmpD
MLEIHDVEVLDKTKLNIVRKKSKKTQIFLYDTQRRVDDFISKIKNRRNGTYDDVPHFVISKLGMIYQLYDTNYSSNTFNDPKKDRKMIKIAIENLGWLNKNTITGYLNNWIGDPYRTEPHIRNWRNYYFWDKYNETQLQSLSELCNHLCDKHDIFKQTVPSNGYLENVDNFKGIVCKSNFSSIYTDINPSFNFRVFFNNTKQNENKS